MLSKEETDECKNLKNWLKPKVTYEEIDAVLEWLGDSDYLNTKGKSFAHRFWNWTWHKGKAGANTE